MRFPDVVARGTFRAFSCASVLRHLSCSGDFPPFRPSHQRLHLFAVPSSQPEARPATVLQSRPAWPVLRHWTAAPDCILPFSQTGRRSAGRPAAKQKFDAQGQPGFRRPRVKWLWPSRNPSRSPSTSRADRRPQVALNEVHQIGLKIVTFHFGKWAQSRRTGNRRSPKPSREKPSKAGFRFRPSLGCLTLLPISRTAKPRIPATAKGTSALSVLLPSLIHAGIRGRTRGLRVPVQAMRVERRPAGPACRAAADPDSRPRLERKSPCMPETGMRHIGEGRGGLRCRIAGLMERLELACMQTPDQSESALA